MTHVEEQLQEIHVEEGEGSLRIQSTHNNYFLCSDALT